MLHLPIKQMGVACLYLVLTAVEGSRTTPTGMQKTALIGTKHLAVSGDPNDQAPIWESEKEQIDKIPGKEQIEGASKNEGTSTGVEPIDEVSKEVPGEWAKGIDHAAKAVEHLENPRDAPRDVFVMPKITSAMIMESIIGIIMSMLITLCCAFGYTRVKSDQRVPHSDGEEHSPNAMNRGTWRFGLFSCFHDSKICMISCCCPWIRWSDTMRMAGLMGFWIAIIVMAFLNAISPLTGGITFLIMLCIATYRRHQIRMLFGMKSHGYITMFEDCCIYCFCSCCAIAQEARQLEEAYAVGYPLQVKEPLRPSSPSRMQPLQSQRLDYMPPQPSQRLVMEEPRQFPILSMPPPSSQPLPAPGQQQFAQPSLGPRPQMQPQVVMAPQPMGSLPQPMSPQPMSSLPPRSMQSLPPQSMQSLPPVQYQQQQFAPGPPVMMGQPLPMGTPPGSQRIPGSMQSMGPGGSPSNYGSGHQQQ